jgi:ribosomal protein S27AE
MTKEYEEGTYLHEFTEAVPATKTDAGTIAAVTVGSGAFILLALIVGGLGLLISAALFPFGLLVGIPLIFFAFYLGAGTGASVVTAKDDMRPTFIQGECPYCGFIREAKQKTGERIACGRCLNIIVIRGNRFYIPEERLKKFRKRIIQSH